MTDEIDYLTNRPGAKFVGIAKRWTDSFENFYNDMRTQPNAPKRVNHYTWAYLEMFEDAAKKNNLTDEEWGAALDKLMNNIHSFRMANPQLWENL